ncbi:NAD-dependent epimerase/dehydratase family protein [Pseudomaricurvus alkylphenolicus]|uniref:NAD-dependent epimerase/dehydratase family protein n=1 Tax=Pseudomaricurvus alkylphenolicus TaxID=1306991 RepID=UPI00142432F6|nr:NAD-dependent epimerase/dehydratase family protein [Pseudomaricurvus alkylphenolicus]NIB44868.1 NAD-dependent epimerase/dehydratase family protein [Pseudomaricurvus alkylphenolicus]
MQIAVTGANGFVGRALCASLTEQGHRVVELCRPTNFFDEAALEKPLSGCKCVIHTIGKTHSSDSLAQLQQYRDINVDLSASVARAAAKAGVARFIYLSSIKVNGDSSGETPFCPKSHPTPSGAYGISKLEAEQALTATCDELGMELVIVRPPLIFAPHAKGNIASLSRAIKLRLPLPLNSIRNRRSIVDLEVLCSILTKCCEQPGINGQIFLVSNGTPISTADLVRRLAKQTNRRALLVPVPTPLLQFAGRMLGKREAINKLCGNLEVDDQQTRAILNLPGEGA